MPYKVKRPPRYYEIEALSESVRLKLQQLGQLESENSHLAFRHNTLASTCDVVQLLASLRNAGQPSCAEEELLGQLQALMPSLNRLNTCSCDAASQQQQGQAASGSRTDSCGSFKRSSSSYPKLLQHQLQCDAHSSAAPFGGWPDVAEHETLGSLQDPLRMLRHSLRRSGSSSCDNALVRGDAADMSLRQLQDDYQNTVNELALHLSFLHNPFKRSQEGDANPFVNIKCVLARHSCLMTQLVIGGKDHMVPQFMMADCVTGQQLEQHNEQLYEYALQRLNLSREQQLRIQATMVLFQGLLAAIVQERQSLQTQLFPNGMPVAPLARLSNRAAPGAAPAAAGVGTGSSPAAAAAADAASTLAESARVAAAAAAVNTRTTSNSTAVGGEANSPGATKVIRQEQIISRCGSSSRGSGSGIACGSGSGNGSGSGSGGDERSTDTRASANHGSTKMALSQQQQARREQQQQHQQQLAQMFKLLKKESLLKCCCWVGVQGCMTYVQLAKLAVTCFPYPASPIALGQTVDRLLRQQQQQPQQPAQHQQY